MSTASDSASKRPVVAIAGASGFVGRALGRTLRDRFHVVAISRSGAPIEGYDEARRCDLFSLREAEDALEGAELAVYLVHSMMPSAHLTQGRFEDFDLVCADNFARAARKVGVRRVVYLGGLLPSGGGTLSRHLESRGEVERALAGRGVPVTTLRAGLVLGAGGSSFEMMTRLVRKLPAMICPRWTLTRTQPIALEDIVALLGFAISDERCAGRTFDVGAPDVVTYREMMELTAELLGKRIPMLAVPLFSPELSRLWLTLVTGAPRELAAPLVASLRHEMVARDRTLQQMAGVPGLSVREGLARAIAEGARAGEPSAFVGVKKTGDRRVRSVQRMKLPKGRDALFAAEEYMRWLPRAMRGFVRVVVDESRTCRFYLGPMRKPALVLRYAPERSGPDRQLFYVEGGLLARPNPRARLEFRQTLDERTLIAGIHDFEPSLPWPIYTATQALVHALVMALFRRHLARLDDEAPHSS